MQLSLKQKKILKLLSINCRFTNKDIAKAVGFSEDAVAYQINKLLNKKQLASYSIQFFFPMIGYSSYHVWLRTQDVIDSLLTVSAIHSVNKSNGKYDYQLLIFAKEKKDFERTLEHIYKTISIQELVFAKFVENYKEFSNILPLLNVPVSLPTNKKKFEYELSAERFVKPQRSKILSLDEKDKLVISALMKHPRANYQELMKQTKLNHETIRYRLKRLVKERFITNFGLVHNFSKYGLYVNYFLMSVDTNNLNKFLQYVHKTHNIFYCAKLEGEYNCIIYVASNNPEELGNINTNIRQSLGTTVKQFDMLFLGDILKYEQFPEELL